MARLGIIATVLLVAGSSYATTIPVPPGTIQEAINAAHDGDTVLVADGLYNERISFLGKKIIVASQYLIHGDSLHIDSTIIDGRNVVGPGDTTAVVRFVSGEDTTSVLCGFSLKNGIVLVAGAQLGGIVSAQINNCRLFGGGLEVSTGGDFWMTSAVLDSSRLIDCGVDLSPYTGVSIHNSEIDGSVGGYARWTIDNSTLGGDVWGGGLITASTVAGTLCAWDRDIQARNDTLASVSVLDLGNVILDSCVIGTIGENPMQPGNSVDARYCLVKDSVYFRNMGARFSHSTLLGPIVQRPYQPYPVRFTKGYPEPRAITLDSCILDVSRDCAAGQLMYDYAIVCNTTPYSDVWRVRVHCSNIFGYKKSWLLGTPSLLDTSQVTFLDPLFCNPASGDYSLNNSSPCAAKNNICGVQIGRLSPNCGTLICGDANMDGQLTAADVDLLKAYYFSITPDVFVPVGAADMDCNDRICLNDLIMLAGYFYGFGPTPCCAQPPKRFELPQRDDDRGL